MLDRLLDRPFEHPVPVLRNPHNVIVALVDRVRKLAIFASSPLCHTAKLRHSQTNITTVKDGGLSHRIQSDLFWLADAPMFIDADGVERGI